MGYYKFIFKFLLLCWILTTGSGAELKTIDLKAIAAGKGTNSIRMTLEWIQDDLGKSAVAMKTTPGTDGFALAPGLSFSNGVIEFDAKGKSGPPQSNFMGIAFRIKDDGHYDSVYFRPFNFRAIEKERRDHSVQYMSVPDWPWPRLRSERPGQFEKPIEPAPDGDAWFHAKIVIQKPKIKVFVNHSADASLVVEELTDRTGGGVGLWCNGFGSIANLKIASE
jgi:hypothetical protein